MHGPTRGVCWWARVRRGGSGGRGAVPREEGDALETAGVLWGPGADFGIVHEEVVDEAALVGIHGVELKGLAGGADLLGEEADAVKEALGFAAAEVFHVEADARGLRVLLAKELIEEVLEVVEALSLGADEGLGLGHADVEGRPGGVFGELDGSAEAEVAEHGIENFLGAVGGIHSGEGNPGVGRVNFF